MSLAWAAGARAGVVRVGGARASGAGGGRGVGGGGGGGGQGAMEPPVPRTHALLHDGAVRHVKHNQALPHRGHEQHAVRAEGEVPHHLPLALHVGLAVGEKGSWVAAGGAVKVAG